MMFFDTVQQLTKYGMELQRARQLVNLGIMPTQLIIPNHTSNLELLAAHMDLNDCPPESIMPFLDRAFSINQRMEVIPEWFSFSEEAAREYLDHPLNWRRDVYEGIYAQNDLRELIQDAELISKIMAYMYTSSVCLPGEEFHLTCLQLSRINTSPEIMDTLLRNHYHTLFSSDFSMAECIDRLIEAFGLSGALKALMRHPLLPGFLHRSRLCEHSPEEIKVSIPRIERILD